MEVNELSIESVYQKNPNMVARSIIDEVVLIPIRSNAADLESIYALNDTAAFAWELFDGQHTLAEISDRITNDFEVDQAQARADLADLVAQLIQIGAVLKV